MYKDYKQVFENLKNNKTTLHSIGKAMNRRFKDRDIEGWMELARGRVMYKMWAEDDEKEKKLE